MMCDIQWKFLRSFLGGEIALARPDYPSFTQLALRIFDYNLKTDGTEVFVSKMKDRLKAAQLHAHAM
jgi:hypothetical protein